MTRLIAGVVGYCLLHLALGAAVLALGGALPGCYAHTGPNPNCAANPYQEACYPPVHDQRKPRK